MKKSDILARLSTRLGIDRLNAMQETVSRHADDGGDMILLSPTGTGKTIAYLLPLLQALKDDTGHVQCVVIAPSRELVQQIYGVARAMIAADLKISCCYGGHNVTDEKNSLAVAPTIVISTPGRLLDHIDRHHIDVSSVRILVLDEFDKSLELGFHDEMSRIVYYMKKLSRRILTSATMIDVMPAFLRLNRPVVLNFLEDKRDIDRRMAVWRVVSPDKDKLETLRLLLNNIADGRTMVFVNYRESAERIYDFLKKYDLPVGLYHGGLEQVDREKAVILFNNGSVKVLVATDLASRGLDITEVVNIIHYHLPINAETYTHRNGRTARVDASGEVYVIIGSEEQMPNFICVNEDKILCPDAEPFAAAKMVSLYFNAGRKEKLSRGDIAGFLLKNSPLTADEVGKIDLYDHYAIAAIAADKAQTTFQQISSLKIKNKRLKITLIKI